MYKEYNDDELLYLIGESNEEAHNIIYEKYKSNIDIKVKTYMNYARKIGLEYNDLFQEGMVGLSQAIMNYKDNRETKFSSFASMCINRRLLSTLEKFKRTKYAILNNSCSIDSVDKAGRPIIDSMFINKLDPSETILIEENTKDFYEDIYKELTDVEKEVFDLKIAGFNNNEISNLTNKSYKSVDGTLQRIKLKIKKILNMN